MIILATSLIILMAAMMMISVAMLIITTKVYIMIIVNFLTLNFWPRKKHTLRPRLYLMPRTRSRWPMMNKIHDIGAALLMCLALLLACFI
jgi:hypothetical protein